MKLRIAVVIGLFLFCGCTKAGFTGGKCFSDGTCALDNLVCGYGNKCEPCGENDQLCCINQTCDKGMACTSWNKCAACGKIYSPCCPGDLCNENMVCNAEKTCEFCGSNGDPCCQGDVCSTFNVCAAGMCISCGQEGEPCCESAEYSGCFLGACIANNTCQTQICSSPGNCYPCGEKDQPCCEGNTCDNLLLCGKTGTCESCGYLGDQVCAGGTCGGWWQNKDGFCINPFEFNPSTDTAICETGDISHDLRTGRDWCYWYAAFYKQDTTPCSLIEWSQMQEKCMDLEDPGFYSIMPY